MDIYRLESFFKPVLSTSVPLKRKVCTSDIQHLNCLYFISREKQCILFSWIRTFWYWNITILICRLFPCLLSENVILNLLCLARPTSILLNGIPVCLMEVYMKRHHFVIPDDRTCRSFFRSSECSDYSTFQVPDDWRL